MAINPQQTFANYILSKVAPACSGTTASNLEWNAKKFLGQVPGETLDAATYAERTMADLEAAAAAGNSDASGAIATLSERFGIARSAGNVASSSSSGGSGHTGGGVSGGGGSGHSGHSGSGERSSELGAGAGSSGGGASGGGEGGGDFDIFAFLSSKADEADEELSWDTSVVDLLKLLGKDHSKSARAGYMEALDLDSSSAGSAEGNEDLRLALMDELAANRGEWPSKLD